jgi:hypothetical protein
MEIETGSAARASDDEHAPSRMHSGCTVQLCRAPLPFVGAFADHYWFVVFQGSTADCQRWEVWQTRNAGGHSVGHVHRDLLDPYAGVGGGPSEIVAEWHGEIAQKLRAVLEQPRDYPHCDRYHYWPGPNSNTYAAWVLREAGIDLVLDWKALGSRYTRR